MFSNESQQWLRDRCFRTSHNSGSEIDVFERVTTVALIPMLSNESQRWLRRDDVVRFSLNFSYSERVSRVAMLEMMSRICVCVCACSRRKREEDGVVTIERSLPRLYSDKSKRGNGENHTRGWNCLLSSSRSIFIERERRRQKDWERARERDDDIISNKVKKEREKTNAKTVRDDPGQRP
jgi:hypothetical protein